MEGVSTFFEQNEVNFDSLKNLWSTPQPQTWSEEISSATSLSWSRRLILFVIFFILGVVFIVLSTFFIFLPRTFAKFYSFGNLFMLGSTFFLVGPWQQLKNMLSRERFFSTVIYLFAFATRSISSFFLMAQEFWLSFDALIISSARHSGMLFKFLNDWFRAPDVIK